MHHFVPRPLRPQVPALFSSLILLVTSHFISAQNISNGLVTVRAVRNEAGFTGFNLLTANGGQAAVVRLSSARVQLTADSCQAEAGNSAIVFRALQAPAASGLRFAAEDFIRVQLKPEDPYPLLAFNLTIASFDPAQWQKAVGSEPFHFLALYLPEAEAWHQRGWLNATPLADRFPLLEDRHAGTPELSAYHYNRNWSYTPPLGAHPLPVIGLWAPGVHRYVGLEFQMTRLEDNSEKDIATGYRWEEPSSLQQSNAGQFVALVYPFGGQGYQQLVFPVPGSRLQSRGTLLWSRDLPATSDPNQFVWSVLWERISSKLPRVPPVPDVGWIPGGIHLRDFEGAPHGGLIGGVEKPFQVDGSRLIYGWGWHNESPTAEAARHEDTNRLQQLEQQARELLKFAKHFQVAGEECVFWEKPLEGQWTAEWGDKPATTLHNANGFAAGRLFLGLYRDRHVQQYLPIVDGVLNWAKHIAWTRNEFADVPSSPFAIGGTLSAAFCLEYHFLFQNAADALHRERARAALELARAFTYRYLVMWPSDNNRVDNLNPAFLWEPNSGRDWTGAACANEVFWNLDTLAQTAAHTGDPVLTWALQGSLSRWHLLYQDVLKDKLADYRAADMTEGFGLYPGNIYGTGKRAAYGFAAPLTMTEPVGDSFIRVLAGEKSVLAFKRGSNSAAVADYRYGPAGSFAFTVRASAPTFDLSLTEPYMDLSDKPVAILRARKRIELKPGSDLIRPRQALWSVYLKNLEPNDRVMVGEPDEGAAVLPSAPPLAQTTDAPQSRTVEGPSVGEYRVVPLPHNALVDLSWENPAGWAGLAGGRQWFYDAPFQLQETGPCCITHSLRLSSPIRNAETAYLLYEAGTSPEPFLVYEDGKAGAPPSEALAWRAWPPLFTGKLLCARIPVGSGRSIVGIHTTGRPVWALTIRTAPDSAADASFAKGTSDWRRIVQQDAALGALREQVARLALGSVAVLPPAPGGEAWSLAQRVGLAQRATVLNPEQLVNPELFSARKFPVALYLDGEDYVHTVRGTGDGAAAIERYVKEGGTLILIPSQPWPLYYATGSRFHRPEPITDRLGLPLFMSIETAPAEKLCIRMNPGQNVFSLRAAEFPYPEGDARLRAIDAKRIPSGTKYTPIATVFGESGKNYGDAAGLLQFSGGSRILYLASVLQHDPTHGFNFSESALRFTLQSR